MFPPPLASLASDDTPRRTAAVKRLARSVPDEAHRAEVLNALRPFVTSPHTESWDEYVVAFCWWADAREVGAVKLALADSDAAVPRTPKNRAAAAACAALLRFDPVAGVSGINVRIADLQFRLFLMNDLGRGPMASRPAVAAAVLERLRTYKTGMQITAPAP